MDLVINKCNKNYLNNIYLNNNALGCVGMNYLSKDEGIAVNVSYGESLLHSQQVKPSNPEPICMSLLINLVEVCARFASLEPLQDGLKGCLILESKVFGDVQTQFDIGCFNSGPNGMKFEQSQNNSFVEIPLAESIVKPQ